MNIIVTDQGEEDGGSLPTGGVGTCQESTVSSGQDEHSLQARRKIKLTTKVF